MLVDWSQNDDHKTTVCVYSLRAKERPTVSTPVTWDEVEAASATPVPAVLTFEPEVLERVERTATCSRRCWPSARRCRRSAAEGAGCSAKRRATA